MADRFFIAPFDENSGLQTNVKPWLVPDVAFAELNNAYVFRGRVRKRFGSRWIGDDPLLTRFKINIGELGSVTPKTLAGNVRLLISDAGLTPAVGQAFSVGSILFTVVNPAGGTQQMLRTDNSVSTATYDLNTSAFNLTDVDLPNTTPVYFYPALPVMGLATYQQSSGNIQPTVGFDTRYAYVYLEDGGWIRSGNGLAVWNGSNSQFFWTITWTGTSAATKLLFVTNFNENEPNYMRYFDGSTWSNFRPLVNVTDYLNCARIIVPFKNRLVAFNTWEGASVPGMNYVNRIRYSQAGSPLDADAWRRDIPGRGGGVDIPTTQSIVTVEFVKDRLIIFCEQSTWELVYTGNQAAPFNVQQINTELGVESTNSIVPFDKICIGIGNVGIHACNGSNVERIDDKIPDEVFAIHNTDQGVLRTYGIRDYFVEMVYWTFPDTQGDPDYPYPNRVLVFNYKTGTWALNNDSITCFGYFQPVVGVTWDSTTVTWNDDVTWDSGAVQSQFKEVIGGNQQGYTFICDSEVSTNAAVLQITNITLVGDATVLTIIQHNLQDETEEIQYGSYIYIDNCVWSDASNSLNGVIYPVSVIIDPNTVQIIVPNGQGFTGTYMGGGVVSRVSQISIKTKQYNFYQKDGRNAYISKVDFVVDATSAGQIDVNYFVSTAAVSLLYDNANPTGLLGTGTLDTFPYVDYPIEPYLSTVKSPIPFEATASQLRHPLYFDADGEVVQLQFILNEEQMKNVNIRDSGFALHAMCIYAQPSSYRFQ